MLRIVRLALLAAFAVACGESPAEPPGPGPGDPGPTVSSVTGIVRSSATGEGVPGAEVTIGAVTATTGDDGGFTLGPVETGVATIRCTATGYVTFQGSVKVTAGEVRRDMALTRLELFEFEEFALHVPAKVSRPRAILLALGGPDTRGFASDSAFGAPMPEVEAALHALGEEFRGLAAEKGLAVLGTSRAALPNGPESDALLRQAVAQAATLSGRSELLDVPLLIYGMSGGAPEASGLAARSPERVAALFLKVPAGVELPGGGPALGVPTYLILAENDAFVDNAALEAAFRANRTAGALWALARERDATHFSLTPAQRALTVEWMRSVLERRVGTAESTALSPIDETSGWLGDPVTDDVAPWPAYPGDRASASWLPSQGTADAWRAFRNQEPPFGAVQVTFDPHPWDLPTGIVEVGLEELFPISVRDERGEPVLSGVTVRSDDESVATARTGPYPGCTGSCGLYVKVLGEEVGVAKITVEYEGVAATATVQVVPAELGLYPGTLTLAPGEAEWFKVTGVAGSGQAAAYSSEDEAVATLGYDQLCQPDCPYVYVLGHTPGTSTITATLSGEVATAVVHVVEP